MPVKYARVAIIVLFLATHFSSSVSAAPSPALSFGRTNYTVGVNPVFVVTGQFDGDTSTDLAVVNNVSKKVTILLNDGTGAFPKPGGSPYPTLPTGKSPLGAAVGKFSGDLKPILAIANFQDNTVSIFLVNGNGTFTEVSALSLPAGSHPIFIATGDFDGNNQLDLAVANNNANSISVFLGHGDGTFTETSSVTDANLNQPISIAVGDFDGNSTQDLAVANFAGKSVSVFLGNGDGTFTAVSDCDTSTVEISPTCAVGTQPVSIVAGKFDGDTNLDLAVANEGNKNVSILLGNGDGTFQTAQSFGLGKVPVSLTAADFNGDGALDLAAAHFPGKQLSIILGNGDGTFGKAKKFNTAADQFALTSGDFDGDGHPDLAVVNGKISVLLNTTVFPGAAHALAVTAPSGGDSLSIGSTASIDWTSNDIPGSHVKIDLTRDSTNPDGIEWKNIIKTVAVELGTKSWKVTGSATTHAQIRVCSIEYPAFCSITPDFSISGP